MKTAIIGYTGFVGSNIDKNSKFDYKFNSKNILEILNHQYDLIVSCGIRAEKFLANKYPEKDMNNINNFIDILKKVKTKKIVAISTIDVYDKTLEVDENYKIDKSELEPYGLNRKVFEEFIQSNFEDYLIIRLPALYGMGLKKNFIYDLINKIPSIIMKSKFEDLLKNSDEYQKNILNKNYIPNENGDFKYIGIKSDREELIEGLEKNNFTSLVFTDYRSSFPFYNLDNLWRDINIALNKNIKLLNITAEPLTAKEIANYCCNIDFKNIISNKNPVKYDIKSIYDEDFGGKNGYMYSKDYVLEDIKKFIENMR